MSSGSSSMSQSASLLVQSAHKNKTQPALKLLQPARDCFDDRNAIDPDRAWQMAFGAVLVAWLVAAALLVLR
jgi:hypothetical protein